jgi:hypothetical protein
MRNRATTAPQEAGDMEVVGWRLERLLAAGFAAPLAADLAADCRVDLHRLIEMVEQGCPPLLAARILAPADAPRRPC